MLNLAMKSNHLPEITRIRWTSLSDLIRILKITIDVASYNPHVRMLAENITKGTGTNYSLKLQLIERFLRTRFSFNRDPKDREYLQTPTYLSKRLLGGENISGDCDDTTTLILALTKSIGFDAYMLFTSPNSQIPFTHVIPVIVSGGFFYPMDITVSRIMPNFPEPIKLVKV